MNGASKTWRMRILVSAVFAVFAAALPARADDEKKWEFGIDPGVIYPLKGGQFGHVIDNASVANMLNNQGEGVAEEVAEGMAPLPIPGNSIIAASIPPLPEIAGHLDYRLNGLLAVGFEGGWGFRRGAEIDKQGIYDGRFLSLRDQTWILHMAPVARAAHTFLGKIRTTATFGPEWTAIWEQATITFTDPDDSIRPYTIVNQANSYFGVVGGARLEWLCTEHGSLQLGVEYHKLFATGGKFDFMTPQAGFVARF